MCTVLLDTGIELFHLTLLGPQDKPPVRDRCEPPFYSLCTRNPLFWRPNSVVTLSILTWVKNLNGVNALSQLQPLDAWAGQRHAGKMLVLKVTSVFADQSRSTRYLG